MNENKKKGQKDSEEEESIYEKEGKEGNNDMCGKFTITRKTKQRKKKIQLKNTDENVVWSKIKKKYKVGHELLLFCE